MAGINFEKYHGAAEAKAMFRHCDKEQRYRTERHSNEHINKSVTCHNFQFVSEGNDATYQAVCAAYDDRLQSVDEEAVRKPRKDRVTLVGMELPRPKDLSPEKFMEWSLDAIRTIREYYSNCCPKDGFLVAYGHVDEVHEYKRFDEATQGLINEISREHIHTFFIPYSPDGTSLTAKEFTKRMNMIALNKAVNDMSVEKYGVQFNDGSQRKSIKSMEELKSASWQLEQKAIQYLEDENSRLRALNAQLEKELAAYKQGS